MGVKVKEWKGAWWVFINHRGQRRATRVGVGKTGEKSAEMAAIEIAARLARGESLPKRRRIERPSPVPTFGDVAREWLERYPALHAIRPSTAENYRSFVQRHLLPRFDALPIDQVTPAAIEAFIEAKRLPGGSARGTKGLGDASLKVGLVVFQLVLRAAVRRKLIPSNPMAEVEWRGAQRVEHVDPFKPAELRAILGAERLKRDRQVGLGDFVRTLRANV